MQFVNEGKLGLVLFWLALVAVVVYLACGSISSEGPCSGLDPVDKAYCEGDLQQPDEVDFH